MAHVIIRYARQSCPLSEVSARLQEATNERARAQYGELPEEIAMHTFHERAQAVKVDLMAQGPERYQVAFPEGHAFAGFWIENDDLSAGMIEYRLRYMEGVRQGKAY